MQCFSSSWLLIYLLSFLNHLFLCISPYGFSYKSPSNLCLCTHTHVKVITSNLITYGCNKNNDKKKHRPTTHYSCKKNRPKREGQFQGEGR